jgi:sphinganine C4-monooxygenase
MNTTACANGSCASLPATTPFYYADRPDLLPWFSDHVLSLAAPVFAYWSLSLAFHALDVSGWRWLEKYRIHESTETRSRNLVDRRTVIWAVVFQQVIQTAMGWWWIEEQEHVSIPMHLQRMAALTPVVEKWVYRVLGNSAGRSLLSNQRGDLVYFVYWWGIPIAQFFFAM